MNAMYRRIAGVALLWFAAPLVHGATLTPLETFGGGDGWRAPFEVLPGDSAAAIVNDPVEGDLYRFLGNALTNTSVNAGNLERGLAYNPTTGNLILVSRQGANTGSIRILDGTTGVDVGELPKDPAIVTGGNFANNMVGVADDGAIYVGNLSTNTTSSPFKIYRWANEAAAATVAYQGLGPTAPLDGARIGDTLDVFGSGANTRLVAGYYHVPSVPGNNSFALFTTADGATFAGEHIAVPTDPPAAGDFRLGITFADADTVIGKQGVIPEEPNGGARIVDITGPGTGQFVQSVISDGATLRAMDYAVVNGRPLLAMINATADTIAQPKIFVYDMTDPSLPVAERKIAEATTLPLFDPVTGPNQFANVNGTGAVKFGEITGNVATIYAMSTNNGIQAFTLTLDPVVGDDADFDDDGDVDGADFLTWQRNLGGAGTGTPATGDANGDLNVDAADLDAWKAQFNSGPAVAAAPEPTAGVLSLAAGLLLTAFRRRAARPLA